MSVLVPTLHSSVANAQDAGSREDRRVRVHEFGLTIGSLTPGENNAITDVPGVLVGHSTLVEGDSIRTGVTAIMPHSENVFQQKVPAAIYVANGFGKLTGTTQVEELGTIETPIVLTNTLAVWRAAHALVSWTLRQPGNQEVRSVNPVVGETNDGYLNAIRVVRITANEVEAALAGARSGPVTEGSVGAGTGTRALGFKGGIGTASRVVRIADRVFTLGVLVQSNFGGALEIAGVGVGKELGRAGFVEQWRVPERGESRAADEPDADGGSVMIVVATDAPVGPIDLKRIARRAPYAIGRVGGFSSHGSGDYVIAFSTNTGPRQERVNSLNPLFMAVVEATEEAILNSLFMATSVTGHRGEAQALPLDRVREILRVAEPVGGQEQ